MIGIYALYWENISQVYIGQSQNIELRFKEHLRKCWKGIHTNYKVQNTYNLYGKPELVILEQCTVDELNQLEVEWTLEFDSINNGLNITEAGSVGYGTNSNASKYSKLQILLIFRALSAENRFSNKEIAEQNGVSVSLIKDIFSEKTHTWLKEKYPFRYRLLINRKHLGNNGATLSLNKKYSEIWLKSPNGDVFQISEGYANFCRSQPSLKNLVKNSKNIGRLIDGSRKTWYGWSLYKLVIK
jgi:hypothetical protein